MMIGTLKDIIGKKVRRLILIVWPPFGESDPSQIDLSAGYVFEDTPDELLVISTDKNDLTTPIVEHQPVPKKLLKWSEFDRRMKDWMDCEEEGMVMDTEYYDVSNVDIFQNIVNQKVQDVELVKIVNDSPIGVKLIFDNDFIFSTPINDGNTIETSSFNKNENLKNFEALGEIEHASLKRAIKNGLSQVAGVAAKGSTNLLGTVRTNLLSRVQNPKLKNIVNDLYRPGAKVGSGSSMDAFRLEKLAGGTVGGKSHHTKLLNYRTALQRVWGNRANLSPSDRQITKQLLQDIQNALSGY